MERSIQARLLPFPVVAIGCPRAWVAVRAGAFSQREGVSWHCLCVERPSRGRAAAAERGRLISLHPSVSATDGHVLLISTCRSRSLFLPPAKIFARGGFENRKIEVVPFSSKLASSPSIQFVAGENSRPPCRPAALRETEAAHAAGEYASAYGPTPFLWSFRPHVRSRISRVGRKDGTECPLGGPRARKGAGSGGTPDMADTREVQSNQAFLSVVLQIWRGISCIPRRIPSRQN